MNKNLFNIDTANSIIANSSKNKGNKEQFFSNLLEDKVRVAIKDGFNYAEIKKRHVKTYTLTEFQEFCINQGFTITDYSSDYGFMIRWNIFED